MSRISLFGHSSNPRSSSPGWGSQRKRSLLHIDTHRTLMSVIMFLFVMLMITAPVSASSRGTPRTPGTNVIYINYGIKGSSGINPVR